MHHIVSILVPLPEVSIVSNPFSGVKATGCHDIDQNPAWSDLTCEAVRKSDNRCLGGSDMTSSGVASKVSMSSHVDNTPPTALYHSMQGGLSAKENAIDVHSENLAPVTLGHFQDWHSGANSYDVHQNVNYAELFDTSADQMPGTFRSRDIGDDSEPFTAGGSDFVYDRVDIGLRCTAVHNNIRTHACKS